MKTVADPTQQEHLHRLVDYVPFVSLVLNHPNRPWLPKLVETAGVALVSALLAVYINDKLQDKSIAEIGAAVQRVEARLTRMEKDIYVPRWNNGNGVTP